MGERPILPQLLSMAAPVMLSMLIQALYNVVDGIWVTKLGNDALTAVSLAFPLQNLVMAAGVGMGIGVGSLVSRCLGAGDRDKADRAASTGIALVLLHCVVFLLIGLFVTRPFLALFTDDSHILGLSCDYTYIVMCLSFGNLIQMCYEKIVQGVGRMTTTMLLMASGCIINLVLDPILIFGWLGAPAMGVKGAAWATIIGQVTAMILYVVLFAVRDYGVSVRPRFVRFDRELIQQLYSVGLSSSLMLATPSILTGILNGILESLGSIYVAVFGLYFKLQTFINMPSSGLVMGMRPLVGYNYGAGLHARAREAIRWSFLIIVSIMAAGTIAAVGFPAQLLQLFQADEALVAAGVPALRLIGLGFPFSAMGFVSCGTFEALGRGKDSLIISMLRQLVILVPLGFVLSRFWGAVGVWAAFPIAEGIACLVAVLKLRDAIKAQLS